MRLFLFLAAGVLVFAGCETPTDYSASTQDRDRTTYEETDYRVTNPEDPAVKPTVPPDNSATNKRDSDLETKTPLDQSQTQADINLTAKIRQEVMDANLSINAQNVKIITEDGKVTLRGVVDTAEEKTRIEEIAKTAAGTDKVDSHLEVKQ